MEILAIENTRSIDTLNIDSSTPNSVIEKQIPEQKPGLALHQLFNDDVLSQISPPSTFLKSIWRKLFSWSSDEKKNATTSTNPPDNSLNFKKESISFEPVLTPPSDLSLSETQTLKLPPPPKRSKFVLTPIEISDALSALSEKSIESILTIIFSSQIDLEKEQANVAEGTFSKYVEFQQVQQKVLEEIKDVLAQDESFAKKLNKAQYIAFVATIITGIAAAAVTFGLLAPVAGIVAGTLGARAGDIFRIAVTNIGGVGPAVTAGLTALTTGTKAYFQRRADEHLAEHEKRQYTHEFFVGCVDDSRERLMTVAESDQAFRECWVRFLKRAGRMQKIIFKRNR